MNFIFMGSPGSGKGTCAQYLTQKYGLVSIAPGNMIRDEIEKQTALGKFVQPLYESGHYLGTNTDAETTMNQVARELICNKIINPSMHGKHFIIDGFPRSHESFLSLHKFFLEQNLASSLCCVEFIASPQTCLKRIAHRRVCPQCFSVYNSLIFDMRKCCHCSTNLIIRKNDAPEFAQERINFYYETIEPVLHSSIKQKYRVEKIKTECPLEALQERYEKLVNLTT